MCTHLTTEEPVFEFDKKDFAALPGAPPLVPQVVDPILGALGPGQPWPWAGPGPTLEAPAALTEITSAKGQSGRAIASCPAFDSARKL